MTRTLYLIRALHFDDVAQRLAQTLSNASGADVVFICDESRSKTDTAPFAKISLTPARLKTLGLGDAPSDWGWFWGDICYYAALAQYADYDFYTLIESDVFFSRTGAETFVEVLSMRPEQALAVRLGPLAEPPRYSRGLKHLGLDPAWGCIFPVSRVHRDVIRAMLKLRKRAIQDCPKARLNDESMLAGAVQEGGFSYGKLDDIMPDLFPSDTFDTNPPHLFDALLERTAEQRVFHPTVQLDLVMQRIASGQKNYGRHRLRRVLKMADENTRRAIMDALEKAS